MGDSDDEFDKRRGRDKFRRERPDYPPERRDRSGWDESGRGRGEWRGKRDRTDSYGDRSFGRGGSPPRYGSPPQAKRVKRDWEEFDHSGPNYSGDMPPPSNPGKVGGSDLDFPTQPPMMTFKSFLQQQEDNITDEEAIRKFNEYKLDFKKLQINEFFLQHKDEEWFKCKYQPGDYDRRKEEAQKLVKKRCDVFAKVLEMGLVGKASVDIDNSSNVIKLLDAAVIMMEGGTDFDLQCLEEEHQFYVSEKLLNRQTSEVTATKPAAAEAEKPAAAKAEPTPAEPEKKEEPVEDDEGDGEIQDEDEDGENKDDEKTEKADEEKPEASAEEKMDDDSVPTTTTNGEEGADKLEQAAAEDPAQPEGGDEGNPAEAEEEKEAEKPKQNGIKKKKKKKRRKTTDSDGGEEDQSDDSESGSESESEEEEEETPPGDEPPPPGMEGADSETYNPQNAAAKPPKETSQEEEKEKDTAEAEEEGEPRPRPLHKTQSVFLRNLAPIITKQEIEAMCRSYPGFLRLALQDPAPERKFFRRGWATFDRSVNIKEICWNITNIRLKDQELGAIVNKELQQRVRPVNGITANRQVGKADIKHCAKIVQNFDKRWGLWTEPAEKKDHEKQPRFGLISNNPVLKNITDYLVDEGSYEEEAYLGKSLDEPCNDGNIEVALDRDDELITVLDRMILYLRMVHSFDYYSCVEYPNEDEMPHRCGIMHGRGPQPINRINQNEIEEWISVFDRKILSWEELKTTLTDKEAARLGRKDAEGEVEKFILGNTQELAKDKWLCPLSGKKFKGPDFVRKHMQNKYATNLDEVRQEVVYFNNFLLDPKRPCLPDHPANKTGGVAHRPDGYTAPPQGAAPGGYQAPQHHHPAAGGYQPIGGGGGGYNSYRGGGPPMQYAGRGGRGRGGPPMRGGYQGYNRGGYNNSYHDNKPDYRRERSYDRNASTYQPQPRRDRPEGGYRDWDAPEDDPTQ